MKAATRLREPKVGTRHRLENHALEWTVQGYVHGSNASSGLDKGTHTRHPQTRQIRAQRTHKQTMTSPVHIRKVQSSAPLVVRMSGASLRRYIQGVDSGTFTRSVAYCARVYPPLHPGAVLIFLSIQTAERRDSISSTTCGVIKSGSCLSTFSHKAVFVNPILRGTVRSEWFCVLFIGLSCCSLE